MTERAAIVAARRERLAQWIQDHHGGKQSAFVLATGENQGLISGILRDKSFGEALAARLEAKAGMPAGYLVTPLAPTRIGEPATVSYLPSQPTGYSRESMALAVEVARYWIDLQGLQGGVEDHIPLLYLAHQLVLEAQEPATVLDLSKKLAARLREETGNGDQRDKAEGPGRAGGAVRGRPSGNRKK